MAGETIERAAIRDDAGVVYSVPRPGRHHDVINHMLDIDDAGFIPPVTGEQGFTTSTGRFVGREEAMQIAQAAGQLIAEPHVPDMLFSEDVW